MKKAKSIDGFVLRRNPSANAGANTRRVYLDSGQLVVQTRARDDKKARAIADITLKSNAPVESLKPLEITETRPQLDSENDLQNDIDSSLMSLPDLPETSTGSDNSLNNSGKKKLSRAERKKAKKAKQVKHRVRRRVTKIIIVVLVVVLVCLLVFLGWKAWNNLGKIFQGNPLDLFTSNAPLKTDANGRTNILVLGTADDDAGHDGGYLTDSIMIISLDQKKYDAYMISLPRDLWVQYGRACPSGYEGKINVVYSCFGGGTNDLNKDRTALKDSMPFFSNITGIDVQYAVNLNYTVLRDTVNAIGGHITVDVKSRDPNGLLDPSFDGLCGQTYTERQKNCPNGHFLQLTNGTHQLNANQALALALARGHVGPTYGFEQGNFDREKNQQLVIAAILKQAGSAGVLSNPTKISSLLDSLGNNLRTTFDSANIKTLMSIAQKLDASKLKSISLIDADPALLTTSMINGQSVVVPVAGAYDYTAVQAFLKRNLSNDPVMRENATIEVYNGGEIEGAASTVARQLTDKNLAATTAGNTVATSGTYVVYDLTGGKKPGTATLLAKELNASVSQIVADELPNGLSSKADFVVIVGSDAQVSQ